MSETVFRLFVSSPGDVAAERARAEAVIEKLNTEFKDRARFDAEFWEDHFYSAHETFQKQIPEAADFDLVVAIFRARLGSPLPEGIRTLPGGEPYPSGTAYEVLSAIAKRRDGAPLPDIYVFRYPRAPQVSLDAADFAEIDKQWRALMGFFERWFETPSGQFVAGFQAYDNTDDFAERVEGCLRQWLAKRGIAGARDLGPRPPGLTLSRPRGVRGGPRARLLRPRNFDPPGDRAPARGESAVPAHPRRERRGQVVALARGPPAEADAARGGPRNRPPPPRADDAGARPVRRARGGAARA